MGALDMRMKQSGLIVTVAGTGINLALGVLYAWSIFKGAIKDPIEKGGGFNRDLASLRPSGQLRSWRRVMPGGGSQRVSFPT